MYNALFTIFRFAKSVPLDSVMKSNNSFWILLSCCHMLLITVGARAQKFDTLGLGWSKTSVNAVIFRRNSITSAPGVLCTSYYDSTGHVVLGVQKGSEPWSYWQTDMRGNVEDAHNSISMIIDGAGYTHFAWDHHNTPLKYHVAAPGAMHLKKPITMIGKEENRVTYPEFYRMPDGNLIFLYRNGESGRGNLIMNRYDIKTQTWQRLQDNLIDGENERSAYWQAYVSQDGTIHLSWVWRETPDVASNHDMCYARSRDGGVTWEKASGEKYSLPINAGNAEYAMKIPQQSELINQTSMWADAKGRPVIATYWREQASTIPQFYIISHDGKKWRHEQVSKRTQAFSLKGAGTKKIPVSRPMVVSKDILVYRDNERGHMVTIAKRGKKGWSYQDFIKINDSSWEPSGEYIDGELKLFLQDVGQGDGEKLANKKPTPVVIMALKP
jgi:hypothetical protein